MKLEEQQRLLRMAMAFYTQAEAPSEDDVESVFWCLITRNDARLRTILRNRDITELNDGEKL